MNMNPNLEKPQGPKPNKFETSGIEDRDQLLGLFRAKISPGTFQVRKEPDPGTKSKYLIVERVGHQLRIHSTFALSNIDGQSLSMDEAKEFWEKFDPLS
jgi:hypothetical protein